MTVGRGIDTAGGDGAGVDGGGAEGTCGGDVGIARDPPLWPEAEGAGDAEVVAGVCEGVPAHCASAARVLGPTTP